MPYLSGLQRHTDDTSNECQGHGRHEFPDPALHLGGLLQVVFPFCPRTVFFYPALRDIGLALLSEERPEVWSLSQVFCNLQPVTTKIQPLVTTAFLVPFRRVSPDCFGCFQLIRILIQPVGEGRPLAEECFVSHLQQGLLGSVYYSTTACQQPGIDEPRDERVGFFRYIPQPGDTAFPCLGLWINPCQPGDEGCS